MSHTAVPRILPLYLFTPRQEVIVVRNSDAVRLAAWSVRFIAIAHA